MDEITYEVPNFVQNTIDMKRAILLSFNAAIEGIKSGEIKSAQVNDGGQMMIMTNFGIVYCDIKSLDEEVDTTNSSDVNQIISEVLTNQVIKGTDHAIAQYEKEIGTENLRVINDSSPIYLENVTVIPYGNPAAKFNFPSLLLFSDQIVGISAGKQRTEIG
ncbi:hypothetical protein P4S95_10270 [Aneurinibacillus aneurinilyticus]|uniref:hypothetical protein n=1 Tax=Aneurinibacillus aneurinilyticus TaxID=1391 RepID=UPI002E246E38|nr:hypothetical protein [Aneurinibacillus aneurinilyticus]